MKLSRFRQHRPGAPGVRRDALRAMQRVGAAGDLPLPVTLRASAADWAEPADRRLRPMATEDAWAGEDTDWLPRARVHWQVGDWGQLAALEKCSLHRHPDRAKLALLAAAGHFQLGGNTPARRLIGLALEWGCDKRLVSQVLVSGLHNTLGRAASVLDQPARALTHFAAAIVTASPGSAIRVMIQSRAREQLAQLGLSVSVQEAAPDHPYAAAADAAAPPDLASQPLALQTLARQVIGESAAGASGAAGQGAIVCDDEWQYLAFLLDARTLRVVQRHLESGRIVTADIAGDYDLDAPHAGLGLGIDADGHLHLCYDTRAARLRSRRSTEPRSIREWSYELALPGIQPDRTLFRRMVSRPTGPSPIVLHHTETAEGIGWHLLAFDAGTLRWDAGAGLRSSVVADIAAARHAVVDIVADAEGAIHLVAADTGVGAEGIRIRHAVLRDPADDGRVTVDLLLPDAEAAAGIELALACGGSSLQALCGERHGGRHWHLRLVDGAWQRHRLADPGPDAGMPRIVLDREDRAHVLQPGGAAANTLRIDRWAAPGAEPASASIDLTPDERADVMAIDADALRRHDLLTFVVRERVAATPELTSIHDFRPA